MHNDPKGGTCIVQHGASLEDLPTVKSCSSCCLTSSRALCLARLDVTCPVHLLIQQAASLGESLWRVRWPRRLFL